MRCSIIADIRTTSKVRTIPTTNIKQQAHRLIAQLPETPTWDDLAYETYVRQALESGLADNETGRMLYVKEEVRAKDGLAT